jgi:putative Mg2+ transporter-C (MgtC) family protein
MPLTLEWHDVAVRLVLTVIAGVLVGINRSERGEVAGLRTTLLVCLAASVSMIQTNLLMTTMGKTPSSFAVLDLMRLPLGILTGMGFIGGGAILRRANMIKGVTTAATLWFVTVIGLCLGGGQLALGMASLVLALITLWGLKRLEFQLHQDRHATLSVGLTADGPTDNELRVMLGGAGFEVRSWSVESRKVGNGTRRKVRCELGWHARPDEFQTPPVVDELTRLRGVVSVRWNA